MPRPASLPGCQYRGAEHGAICFCRHPQIAGRSRSVSVKWEQCQACPLASIIDSTLVQDKAFPPLKHSVKQAAKPWKLGDQISSALATVGVTEERVTSWLGRPCGCDERRAKLNRLSQWAQRATREGLDALIGK